MKEFTISKNDAGQRMDKFITKAIPKLPSSLLYKYIRLKRIKLNGKRCEISSRLSVGDIVQCYVSDEFFEAEEKVITGMSQYLYTSVTLCKERKLLAYSLSILYQSPFSS